MATTSKFTESGNVVYMTFDNFDINKLIIHPPQTKTYKENNFETTVSKVAYQGVDGKSEKDIVFIIKQRPVTGVFRQFAYQEKSKSQNTTSGYVMMIPLRKNNYNDMISMDEEEQKLFDTFNTLISHKFITSMREFVANPEINKTFTKVNMQKYQQFNKPIEEIMDLADQLIKPLWKCLSVDN